LDLNNTEILQFTKTNSSLKCRPLFFGKYSRASSGYLAVAGFEIEKLSAAGTHFEIELAGHWAPLLCDATGYVSVRIAWRILSYVRAGTCLAWRRPG
jgi:hypothetical protein